MCKPTALLLSTLLASTACDAQPIEVVETAPAPAMRPAALVAVQQPASAPLPAAPVPAAPGLAHVCTVDTATHLREAERALAAGDRAAATEAWRLALHDDPGSVEAAAGLARVAPRPLARQAAALWAALAPADPAPALRGARLALDAGDDTAALPLVNQALARDPKNAEAFHLKGRVFFRADQHAAAVAAFESAVELDGDNAFAFNGKGLAHLRLGQWKEALDALTTASLLRPDVAWIQNNLGIAWEKLGYTHEALAAYRLAVTLDPAYVKAQVNYQRLAAVADARWFVIERPTQRQQD